MKSTLYLLILFILTNGIILSDFDYTKQDRNNVNQYSNNDGVKKGSSAIYDFPNNNSIEIITNVDLNLSVDFDKDISFRSSSLEINNKNPVQLEINVKKSMNRYGFSFEPGNPHKENQAYNYAYNCYYQFSANTSIDRMTFRFLKGNMYGIDDHKNYSIVYLNNGGNDWQELQSSEETYNNSIYLEADLTNIVANQDYYITIYEISPIIPPAPDETNFSGILILVLIISIGLILIIGISKTEFLNYLRTRSTPPETGVHRLNLEDVLENENRNKIIDFILEEPGIHFNELLRKTELSPGNLVWHLDLLETYKIIGKKRIGNYIAYFPYYSTNPISNIDLKLSKSKLTLEILEIIEKEPGIYNSILTKKKKVDHKTIFYHLQKLKELDLIHFKKEGRKKKIYPNLDSEYFAIKSEEKI